MSKNYIVVITTFSKEETGGKIVNTLLSQRLAACIQAFPVTSSYTWKGAIAKDSETLLFIKTKAELFNQVQKTILEIHDYETPEIISLPVLAGSKGYLDWIDSVTS